MSKDITINVNWNWLSFLIGFGYLKDDQKSKTESGLILSLLMLSITL